jgi:hypothetical protein
MNELIREVRDHAERHYSDPNKGYDYLVECWTDEKIGKMIEGAKTLDEALDKIDPVLAYFREVENTAW